MVRVLSLGSTLILGTLLIGWSAVPLIGAGWGLWGRKREYPASEAAGAATLGWGLCLLWDSTQGPVGGLGAQLGSLFGLQASFLFALTLVWPALLAATSARLGADLGGALESRRRQRQIRDETPSTPQPGSSPDA